MPVTEKQAKQLQDSLPAEKFDSIQYYWNHLSEEHQYEAEDFPCYQKLSIWLEGQKISPEASEAVTDAFWDAAKETVSLRKVVPVPGEFEDKIAGTDAEADLWFYQNWGTRYEPLPDSVSFNVEDGRIEVSFATALLPADAWVKALASRFPDLCFSIEYAETGNMVSGYWWRDANYSSDGEDFDYVRPSLWLKVGQDTDSYFITALGCPFTLFQALEEDFADIPSHFLSSVLEFDLEHLLYEDGFVEGEDDDEQSPKALEDLIRSHRNFKEDKNLKTGWREPLDPVWML